jgi:hypothetical protein
MTGRPDLAPTKKIEAVDQQQRRMRRKTDPQVRKRRCGASPCNELTLVLSPWLVSPPYQRGRRLWEEMLGRWWSSGPTHRNRVIRVIFRLCTIILSIIYLFSRVFFAFSGVQSQINKL